MRKQIAVWLRACADQLDPPAKARCVDFDPLQRTGTTNGNGYVDTWKRTA